MQRAFTLSAREIAAALDGQRQPDGRFMCRCPVPGHGIGQGDRNRSLSVWDDTDGRVAVNCFASCSNEAVIDTLRSRGLWPERREKPKPGGPKPKLSKDEQARRMFGYAARPFIPDGKAEHPYFGARGIDTRRFPQLDLTLRLLPEARHKDSGTTGPAIVAAVTDNEDSVTGIQRIFLTSDQSAKRPVDKAKMSLGSVKGNAIRLGPKSSTIMVAEGLEDAMTGALAMDMEYGAFAVAGDKMMPGLILPEHAKVVIVLSDNDKPGRQQAASATAAFRAQGRTVSVAYPPEGVKDFNELVNGKTGEELAAGYAAVRAAIENAGEPIEPVPNDPEDKPTRPGDEAVLRLNETYAFIRSRPTGFMDTTWTGLDDDASGRMLSQKAMMNLLSNDRVNLGTEKEPNWVPVFALWMRSDLRREYKDAGYYPIYREPVGVLNLFKGLAVEPRAGRWGIIDEFLSNIICDGDDKAYNYLTNLLFWKIQNPTLAPEVAILLIGKPGSGRGTFAYILKRIFGDRYYKQFTDSSRVGARFNIQLEGRLIVFYDETFFGHDPRIKQILKGDVTEPKRTIEPKGIDPYDIPNMILPVFASNEITALPIDINDRRYLVLRISDSAARNVEYFAKLRAALDEELPAFVYTALNTDLREFELIRRDPLPTKAKSSLALMTGNIAHQYLYRLLEGRELPGAVCIDPDKTEQTEQSKQTKRSWLNSPVRFRKTSKRDQKGNDLHESLYGDYLAWMQTQHSKKPPMTELELFKNIEEIIPPTLMKPKTIRIPGDWNNPVWLPRFPSRREARTLLDAYAGQPIPWEEDADELKPDEDLDNKTRTE
jgi:hypothetical protein